MQIKRFKAPHMSAALQLIKKELGADAVILSARTLKKGIGIFGNLRKAGVEVTAATDGRYPDLYIKNRSTRFDNWQSSLESRTGHAGAYNCRTDSNTGHRTVSVRKRRPGPGSQLQRVKPTTGEGENYLYQMLLAQKVRDQYAREMSSEVQKTASLFPKDKEEVLESTLVAVFEKMGITARPPELESGKQNRIAFIGPSGVGKTSTIAKMAATYAVDMNRRVALISLDNYRVAASDHLKVYARIIGIPFAAAANKNELGASLRNFNHCELVLIDTPAISAADGHRLQFFKRLFQQIRPDEIHLVSSASCKEQDQIEMYKHLKGITVNRLIFTKLDETTTYGSIFNTIIRLQLPVSCLSGGQQIPESIQMANPEILAQLLIKGHFRTPVTPPSPYEKQAGHRPQKKQKAGLPVYYVANRNSDVFHTSDCRWTKMIRENHIVVFKSISEAEAKKFKPCRSCCKEQVERNDSRYRQARRLKAEGMRQRKYGME